MASGLHRPWPHRSGPKRPVPSTGYRTHCAAIPLDMRYAALLRHSVSLEVSWLPLLSSCGIRTCSSDSSFFDRFVWRFQLSAPTNPTDSKTSAPLEHGSEIGNPACSGFGLRQSRSGIWQQAMARTNALLWKIWINSGSQASFCSVTSGLFWSTSREPKIGSKVHQLTS